MAGGGEINKKGGIGRAALPRPFDLDNHDQKWIMPKMKYESEHGKVSVKNGGGRTRLKRKRTGRTGQQVKRSKAESKKPH